MKPEIQSPMTSLQQSFRFFSGLSLWDFKFVLPDLKGFSWHLEGRAEAF